MKNKKRSFHPTPAALQPTGASRRKFLKQSFAFAALTATYSVVSLTDFACRSTTSPSGPGSLGGYYFGGEDFYFDNGDGYFGSDEYFGWEPFFFYY